MISIIIPTKNAERTIKEVLDGINRQKINYDIEIIIIDSGSQDKTIDIISKFDVRLLEIKPEEFHHAKTRNIAVQQAKGEILVFLNQDAIPIDENWLKELIEPLSQEQVVAVYGKQCYDNQIDLFNRFRLIWHYPENSIIKNIKSTFTICHKLYFFSTANCSIKKEIWKKFPFPEDLEIFEDTQFAKNVIQNGYSIFYNTNAKVLHYHNFTATELFKRYFDMGYVQKKVEIVNDIGKSHSNESLIYFKNGIKYLIKKRQYFYISRFTFIGFCGFLGLFLGRNAEKIPFFIKVKLGSMTNK